MLAERLTQPQSGKALRKKPAYPGEPNEFSVRKRGCPRHDKLHLKLDEQFRGLPERVISSSFQEIFRDSVAHPPL